MICYQDHLLLLLQLGAEGLMVVELLIHLMQPHLLLLGLCQVLMEDTLTLLHSSSSQRVILL